MFAFTRRALVIGGFEIYWYGLLIAVGVLAGCLLALSREKRLGIKKDTSVDLVLLGAPIAILCARLYYVAFSWDYYAVHPGEIFSFRDGGMAIYGGIIGALIAGLIYKVWKKIPYAKLADLAAPSFALGQCIGRWGNFLNREAYGAAVVNPALQFFPVSVYIDGSGWHYAAFFYESVWCALIVITLLAAEKRRIFKKDGDVFLAYAFMYAVERAVVEGLRTDSLCIGSLRVSQLVSLLAVLAVACVLFVRAKNGVLRFVPIAAALGMILCAVFSSLFLTALFGLCAIICAALVYIRIEPCNPG